jgi:Alr-MurF fusion protein
MQHQYLASQLVHIWDCDSRIANSESLLTWLLIDSRKLIHAEESLFFALPGKQNSHQYIPELYQRGVRNFVISDKSITLDQYKEANFFIVNNTLKALQNLAAYHRKHFNYEVIGITGSNGKTIVKDWLYQLISPEKSIVRSPKSYNSQIGVPLSVWQMSNAYQMGIFEAGISTVLEMQSLENIIKPSIGILTNIKTAHDEGFSSKEEKLKEKLILFKDAQKIIFSKEYIPDGFVSKEKSFTWSIGEEADLQILNISKNEKSSVLRAYYQFKEFEIVVNFTDDASIENCIICAASMLCLGYSIVEIQERILQLQSIGMRLQMKQGIQQSSIINDSYSADISSLFIAVDFLMQQKHERKTVIVSDMMHGDKEPVYELMANYFRTHQINRIIGIGNEIKQYAHLFNIEKYFFSSTEEFLKAMPDFDFSREGILIKGARKFAFEKIASKLEEKVHDTVMEINLNSIVHNLNFYRSKLLPGTKVMVMVKAFAYGSGSFEVANVLQYNKVDYLAVAYADEGIALRKEGINIPIMVMSPEANAFDKMISHVLEPEIYSLSILKSFINYLHLNGIKQYPIHLKLDTGMHRLGFESADLEELLPLLKNEHISIRSVFSHLAASESSEHDAFTKHQLDLFDRMYAKLRNVLHYDTLRHIANTAAILRFPESHYEMVRLGIGLYGIENVGNFEHELQRVAELKTTVTQVRKVLKNESVGYSRRGVLAYDAEIATIKIGYADGYNRAFGNGIGEVLINGQRAKVIGSVCMDMCMLDVTGMNVQEGDEVIVFGEEPSIKELAKKLNTIPYEVLTSISQRVQRIYYYE